MWTATRKAIYRARGHFDGRVGGERFRLDPYHSHFWRRTSAGTWEPETFAVFDRYLSRDTDCLDIGAWIGPTVLYAARRARHVWAFEPDPTAFRALNWNLELNRIDTVSALPVALSDRTGLRRMAAFRGQLGDSTTSLLNPGGAGAVDVVTLAWDDFARDADLSGVTLVKMDIEGAEFDVLPALLPWLAAQRPALYLSLHPPYLDAADRRDRLAALLDHLALYPVWQTATGQPLTRDALLAPDALARFSSVLLTQ